MAPLLIFMKGSSPIVFAASAETLDQFTTVKPVAHKNQSLPLKLKNQSVVLRPKANFSSSDATLKVASHNASLTSVKSPPAVSNGNAGDTKPKPSARHVLADDSISRAAPKVHVIMATALADPPEFEFRDRSLDSAEDNDGRKYDAYWAVPAHGQLVETRNGYLAGSSPGVSSHVTNQSHVNSALPSAPSMGRSTFAFIVLNNLLFTFWAGFTCGQDTFAEEFVLTNPSYPDPDEDAGRCDFRLRVASASVCQVRNTLWKNVQRHSVHVAIAANRFDSNSKTAECCSRGTARASTSKCPFPVRLPSHRGRSSAVGTPISTVRHQLNALFYR